MRQVSLKGTDLPHDQRLQELADFLIRQRKIAATQQAQKAEILARGTKEDKADLFDMAHEITANDIPVQQPIPTTPFEEVLIP